VPAEGHVLRDIEPVGEERGGQRSTLLARACCCLLLALLAQWGSPAEGWLAGAVRARTRSLGNRHCVGRRACRCRRRRGPQARLSVETAPRTGWAGDRGCCHRAWVSATPLSLAKGVSEPGAVNCARNERMSCHLELLRFGVVATEFGLSRSRDWLANQRGVGG